MYSIERATLEDIETLVAVAKEFMPFHGMKWNEETATKTIAYIVQNGEVFLAYKESEFAGCVGGIRTTNIWNGEPVLQELFWWVEESHRGSSVGIRLLKTLEDTFDGPILMSLLPHTPVKPDILTRMGYSLKELTYIKG